MAERIIWKFGQEYICIEDGSPATEQEVSDFAEKQKQTKIASESSRKIAEEERKQWQEKYTKTILDYFEIYEKEDIGHWDDEWLAYRLATNIFDSVPDDYYYEEDTRDKKDVFKELSEHDDRFSSFLGEMRKTFPDHYDMAIEYFLSGWHDT